MARKKTLKVDGESKEIYHKFERQNNVYSEWQLWFLDNNLCQKISFKPAVTFISVHVILWKKPDLF